MVSVDGNLYSVPDTTRKRQVEVQRSATGYGLSSRVNVLPHPLLTASATWRRVIGRRVRGSPIPGILTRPGEIVATRDLSVYQRIGQAKARETLA